MFDDVNESIPVHIPCGSLQSNTSTWLRFSNFIEDIFVFSVETSSKNDTMGDVSVLAQPTCESPIATVLATPNPGYHFTAWNDGDTENPRTIPVTCDTALKAYFALTTNDTTYTEAFTCKGEPFYWHGQSLTEDGVYKKLLGKTRYGADSIEILTLTFYSLPTKSESAVVCSSDLPYSWRGQSLTAAGEYTTNALAVFSCDTVVTLNLTVNQPSASTENVTLCTSELPYFWNGQSYSAAGTYTYTTLNAVGRDSVVTLVLTVNELPTLTESVVVCEGDLPYLWRGQSLATSGVYTTYAVSDSTCDTIVTLHFTVETNDTLYTSASLCQGDRLLWNGQYLSEAGIYFETIGNTTYGCDSVEQLTITENPTFNDTVVIEIAAADLPFEVNGVSLTTGGIYVYSNSTVEGCDSILTLILEVSSYWEFAEGGLFVVSPNPVEKGGTIVIEFAADTIFDDAEINLYSPSGKLLGRFEMTENVGYIKMPEVAGLYIIQLVTKTGVVKYEKIVVK